MYRSTRAQLLQARKDANNNSIVGSEVNQMLRNQMLMQGITPIITEQDKPDIAQEKQAIMTALKSITTQPTKFYGYLYNTNQIDLFAIGMEEFARKFLKYRKNLSYDQLVDAWERYKLDPSTKIEGLVEIQKRNTIEKEESGRNILLKERETDISKILGSMMEGRESYARKQGFTKQYEDNVKYLNTVKNNIMKNLEKEQDLAKQDILWNELAIIENLKKKANDPRVSLKELADEVDKLVTVRRKKKTTVDTTKQAEINKIKEKIENIKQQKMDYMNNISEQIERFEESNLPDIDSAIRSQLSYYDNRISELENKLKEMSGSGIKRKKIGRGNTYSKVVYPIGRRWDWM